VDAVTEPPGFFQSCPVARPSVCAGSRSEPIPRRTLIALPAGQHAAEDSIAALGGGCPRSVRPRWVVANMLVVTAFELGDPVMLGVLMKRDDPPVHRTPGRFMARVSTRPPRGEGHMGPLLAFGVPGRAETERSRRRRGRVKVAGERALDATR
jgi:hypothetical protein